MTVRRETWTEARSLLAGHIDSTLSIHLFSRFRQEEGIVISGGGYKCLRLLTEK